MHRRSQREAYRALPLPEFLEHIVILCFERRYPKQNNVILLKSNILASQYFWAGYATGTMHLHVYTNIHLHLYTMQHSSSIDRFLS